MIGTGRELLYYLANSHAAREKMGIVHSTSWRLRCHLAENKVGEATVEEYLNKVQFCHKLRDKIIIPAVLESKHGRRYDERTVLYAIKQEDYPEFNVANIIKRIGSSDCLPDKKIIRKICRRGHFKVIAERIELPSVWEYDPVGVSTVKQSLVEKIIMT